MRRNLPRIGLFGGTFNPVHLGHLRAAEEVREILGLHSVYFIPAYMPPHKDTTGIASPVDRLKMLALATQGNPFFRISDVELNRGGSSYTIDTLEYFSFTFPDSELYFVLGSDLFSEIDTWRDYKRLFESSNFAVIMRPGFCNDFSSLCPLALKDEFRYYKQENGIITYLHKSSKVLQLVQIDGIQISSTRIRELIKEYKSIKYLVPNEVESYIQTKKLYAQEEHQ